MKNIEDYCLKEAPAREGQPVFMAAVFALNTGKAALLLLIKKRRLKNLQSPDKCLTLI
jgi:hypothetical protein